MSDNNPILTRLRELLRRQAAAELPPEADITVPEKYKNLGQRLHGMPEPAGAELPAAAAVDLVFLRQALLNHLDEAGLAAVAAAVDRDWAEYEGGKGRKAQALLLDCERHGQTAALLAACRAQWPDVSWQPADD